MRRLLVAGFITLLVVACSSDEVSHLPPQHWGSSEIVIETRPAPVRPGMNEFLVIATEPSKLPSHDMIVSMRMSSDAPWLQAIQDGYTGVYRRALAVKAGQQYVYLQMRRGKQVKVLAFPLH